MGQKLCRNDHFNDQYNLNTEIDQIQQLDYNRGSTYVKLDSYVGKFSSDEKISNNYHSLLTRMIAAKQDHLLQYMKSIPNHQRMDFIQNFELVDYEMLDSLYHQAFIKRNRESFSSFTKLNTKILWKKDDELDERKISYLKKGVNIIENRKVAVVIMAGGKGDRYGPGENKIISDIGLPSGMSLLQLFLERLKKILSYQQVDIFILLNEASSYNIKSYLLNNKYFGLKAENFTFCYQKCIPVVTADGKITMKNKVQPNINPNGTGNVFSSLNFLNYLELLKNKQIEYVHFLGVENLTALPLDPVSLGLMYESNVDVLCKCVASKEQDGFNSKIKYLEDQNAYFLLDPSLNQKLDTSTQSEQSEGSELLNDMIVQTDFLVKLQKQHEKGLEFQSRYHIIKRQSQVYDPITESFKSEETIRFEKFLHDLIEISSVTLFYQVNHDQYIPVVFNDPDYKIKLSNMYKQWLNLKNENNNDLCEISPSVSYFGEGLEKTRESLAENQQIKYPLIIQNAL